MTGTRRQYGTIKCISHGKIDFLRFSLVPFFVGGILEGSIRKNGKLMDHVCFVYLTLFFLIELTKNHELNTVN